MKTWLPTAIAAAFLGVNPQALRIAIHRGSKKYEWREAPRNGAWGKTYEIALELSAERYAAICQQHGKQFQIQGVTDNDGKENQETRGARALRRGDNGAAQSSDRDDNAPNTSEKISLETTQDGESDLRLANTQGVANARGSTQVLAQTKTQKPDKRGTGGAQSSSGIETQSGYGTPPTEPAVDGRLNDAEGFTPSDITDFKRGAKDSENCKEGRFAAVPAPLGKTSFASRLEPTANSLLITELENMNKAQAVNEMNSCPPMIKKVVWAAQVAQKYNVSVKTLYSWAKILKTDNAVSVSPDAKSKFVLRFHS
ncbi:MAG: hypothetical protein LBQ52_09770, partial [Helicobacteraceae bacterium]|nr:hypothetical protein [Helicobacteraceae bacterium]